MDKCRITWLSIEREMVESSPWISAKKRSNLEQKVNELNHTDPLNHYKVQCIWS